MSRDIFFSRMLQDDELVTALAKVFGVIESSVKIEHGELTDRSFEKIESQRVLCSIESMPGDFPCHIYVVPLEKELLPEKYFPVIGALCEHLKCCALDTTGDETYNPFLYTYICGVDDYQLVLVNPDKLDAEDSMQFEIIKYIRRVDAESE